LIAGVVPRGVAAFDLVDGAGSVVGVAAVDEVVGPGADAEVGVLLVASRCGADVRGAAPPANTAVISATPASPMTTTTPDRARPLPLPSHLATRVFDDADS
jgi:hypothetical protein